MLTKSDWSDGKTYDDVNQVWSAYHTIYWRGIVTFQVWTWFYEFFGSHFKFC